MNLRPLEQISLYVHVPFCSSRCRYCDFYFETGRSSRVMQSTLDRILDESRYYAEKLDLPLITTVYFGGGTPSVIPPAMLDEFLEQFSTIWGISRANQPTEWNFEANPESITDELLAVLAAHGINRLSIGIQSFQDGLLRVLGRRARRAVSLSALERIASFRSEIAHVNIDLMTGIPGQTESEVHEDVTIASSCVPDHFSVYSLTIEEHTPMARMIDYGSVRMAPAQLQESLWFAAKEALEHRGFVSYEVSNFALPGAESAHNRSYWRLEPYLGLGPGAVSTLDLETADTESRPVRVTNPNLFIYGSHSPQDLPRNVELLSPKDFLLDHFVTGLRTQDGVSLGRVAAIFGSSAVTALEPLIARWQDEEALLPLERPAADMPQQEKPFGENGLREGGVLALRPDNRLKLDRYLLEMKELIDAAVEPSQVRWPYEEKRPLAKNVIFSYK